MQLPKLNPQLLAALIAWALLLVCLARFTRSGLYSRWSSVKDGMTQAQVRQLLGPPLSTGPGDCDGAGGTRVTRWTYRVNLVWRIVDYYVDFDYIGSGGAPVVFRTERVSSEPNWPFRCPWQAKCRG